MNGYVKALADAELTRQVKKTHAAIYIFFSFSRNTILSLQFFKVFDILFNEIKKRERVDKICHQNDAFVFLNLLLLKIT